MATDQSFARLYNKKILPLDQFDTNLLQYLRGLIDDSITISYFKSTVLLNQIPVVTTGLNQVNVGATGGPYKATTGLGKVIKFNANDSRLQNIKIPPLAGVPFGVALETALIEDKTEINPRTGAVEYRNIREELGRVLSPSSVTWASGTNTLTFNLDNHFSTSLDNSGRTARVWMKSLASGGAVGPQVAVDGPGVNAAFYEAVVTFDGTHVQLTIVSATPLGQVVPSTVASDYLILVKGPTVTRQSIEDMRNTTGAVYLATVTSVATATAIPAGNINTLDQRTATFQSTDISAVIITDPHGFAKIQVTADASDNGQAQVSVRNNAAVTTWSVNEKGVQVGAQGTFAAVAASAVAGVTATGDGIAAGVVGTGGGTNGAGGSFTGGLTNGDGVVGVATGTATGVRGTGGANNGVGGTFVGGATNGKGVVSTGTGTGVGVQGTGGATNATGVVGIGGATNGIGVTGTGTGTGHGVTGTGGATGAGGMGANFTGGGTGGYGVSGTGAGTGIGVLGTGGATGVGVWGAGGATSGTGVNGVGGGGNSLGGNFTGSGTQSGVQGTGGATSGTGVVGTGGAPNGIGVAGTGTGTGVGGSFTGGSGGGRGATFTGGAPNADGARGTGTGTGIGLSGVGGATSGTGVDGFAGAPNGMGGNFTGQGTGPGVKGTGGTGGGVGVQGVGQLGSTAIGVVGQGGSASTVDGAAGGSFTGGQGGSGVGGPGVIGTGGQQTGTNGGGIGVQGIGSGSGTLGGWTGVGVQAQAGVDTANAAKRGALQLVSQSIPVNPGAGDVWFDGTNFVAFQGTYTKRLSTANTMMFGGTPGTSNVDYWAFTGGPNASVMPTAGTHQTYYKFPFAIRIINMRVAYNTVGQTGGTTTFTLWDNDGSGAAGTAYVIAAGAAAAPTGVSTAQDYTIAAGHTISVHVRNNVTVTGPVNAVVQLDYEVAS